MWLNRKSGRNNSRKVHHAIPGPGTSSAPRRSGNLRLFHHRSGRTRLPSGGIVPIPVGQPNHVFNTAFMVVALISFFGSHKRRKYCPWYCLPSPAQQLGIFLSRQHPAVLRIDLIILFQNPAQATSCTCIHGKIPLPIIICIFPYFVNMFLQTTKGFFLRNAGICNPVIMIFQQVPFILWTQVTVIGCRL